MPLKKKDETTPVIETCFPSLDEAITSGLSDSLTEGGFVPFLSSVIIRLHIDTDMNMGTNSNMTIGQMRVLAPPLEYLRL